MPNTVKERIELRLVGLLSGVTGLNALNVQRWDMHGNGPLPDPGGGPLPTAWCAVIPDEESCTEGPAGVTECEMAIDIELHLTHDAAVGNPTARQANDWLARMEMALPLTAYGVLTDSDPELTPLAHDIRKAGTAAISDVVEDQPETVIAMRLLITYRHVRGDPYTPA